MRDEAGKGDKGARGTKERNIEIMFAVIFKEQCSNLQNKRYYFSEIIL